MTDMKRGNNERERRSKKAHEVKGQHGIRKGLKEQENYNNGDRKKEARRTSKKETKVRRQK